MAIPPGRPDLIRQAGLSAPSDRRLPPSTGAGQVIPTIQDLMESSEVKTTMIDTHVLNRGPCGVMSLVDLL